MYSNFIEPCTTEATRRIAGQRRSIVDNIFKNLHGGYLIDKITDHLPNFLFIADFIDQQKNQKTRIRNIKLLIKKLTLRTLIHSNHYII